MVEKASLRMQSYIRKIYAGVPLRYENKIKSKHNIEKKIQTENVSSKKVLPFWGAVY